MVYIYGFHTLQETLEEGCKKMDDIIASFDDVGITDRSMVWNTDLLEAMELENLIINAAISMHSAEQRKESRYTVFKGSDQFHYP